LRKPALLVLAKGGAVLLVVWSAAGLLFMAFLDNGPIGEADRAGAEWLEDRRTATWNSLSLFGSMLSETLVKVVLVVVVGGAMVVIWRRWHDGVFLAAVVSFEAAIFVVSSLIVGRERPPVEQLDPPAPSGSFPSGHSAAAVAFYAGVFVIVLWHTRNRVVRAVFAVVAGLAPLVVAVSRTARGMHHPIDVVAGLLLGVAAIHVVRAAMVAGVDEINRADGAGQFPDRVRRLDLTAPEFESEGKAKSVTADRSAPLTGVVS
jgi:undecaprenyl-diphosphatase